MRRLVILFFGLALGAYGNPVAGPLRRIPASSLPVVDCVMVGESVVVTVSADSAAVVGHYRFRDTPGAPPHRAGELQSIDLPIPIPAGLTSYEEIAAAVHPSVIVRGTAYQAEKSLRYPVGTVLPAGVKLAFFTFRVARDGGKEMELEIRYEQPVVTVDGREMVYYLPYLPHFAQFAEPMQLRPDSFQIRFEAAGAVSLRASSSEADETKSLVVLAKHNVPIGVERMKPHAAPEPAKERADVRAGTDHGPALAGDEK